MKPSTPESVPAKVSGNSWIRLVFPFSFEPGEFKARVREISGRTFSKPGTPDPIGIWNAVDRASNGIHNASAWAEPAVRTFLDGEGGGESPGLMSWTLSNPFRDRYLKTRPKDECSECSGNLVWEFVGKEGARLPLQIDRKKTNFATLTLMRHGAGLIALELTPLDDQLERWANFMTRVLHSNRKQQGLRTYVESYDDAEGSTQVFTWPSRYFSPPTDPEKPRAAYDVLVDLLAGAPHPSVQWWQPVLSEGRLLPYYSISADGVRDEEKARVRFRFGRLATNSKTLDPSDSQLGDDAPGLAQVSRSSWFVASRGGVGFLAFDSCSQFHRENLPAKLKNEGWCLFALAMQQRIALQVLNKRVTQGWGKENQYPLFRDAKDDLMAFTAEAWFPRVTSQSETYADFYRLMVERFELTEMNDAVRNDVNLIHDHLQYGQAERQRIATEEQKAETERQRKISESIEKLIQGVGIPIAVISVVIGVLGINIQKLTTTTEGMKPDQVAVWLGASLVGGLLLTLVIYLFRKRDDPQKS